MTKMKLSWMFNYIQKMNFISKIVFEIFKFKESCNLIGQELDHAQKINMTKMKLSWISNYIQKMNFISQIVFEIFKFKESCNLIGRELFANNLI